MGSWAEGMKEKKPSPRLVILQHLKFRRSEATGVVIVDRRKQQHQCQDLIVPGRVHLVTRPPDLWTNLIINYKSICIGKAA